MSSVVELSNFFKLEQESGMSISMSSPSFFSWFGKNWGMVGVGFDLPNLDGAE